MWLFVALIIKYLSVLKMVEATCRSVYMTNAC